MKKLRWRRIILLLIVLIVLGAMLNYCVRLVSPRVSDDNVKAAQPSQTTQKIVNKTLSNSEKNEIIEKARNQAIQAARASGQSEEDANHFGQLAVKEMENSLNKAANAQ